MEQSSERLLKQMECACSSADRVPGYEPVGRGFESPQARQNRKSLCQQTKAFSVQRNKSLGICEILLRNVKYAAVRENLFHFTFGGKPNVSLFSILTVKGRVKKKMRKTYTSPYPERPPKWYWTGGLHDARIESVETFAFSFDYDQRVKEIRFERAEVDRKNK